MTGESQQFQKRRFSPVFNSAYLFLVSTAQLSLLAVFGPEVAKALDRLAVRTGELRYQRIIAWLLGDRFGECQHRATQPIDRTAL